MQRQEALCKFIKTHGRYKRGGALKLRLVFASDCDITPMLPALARSEFPANFFALYFKRTELFILLRPRRSQQPQHSRFQFPQVPYALR